MRVSFKVAACMLAGLLQTLLCNALLAQPDENLALGATNRAQARATTIPDHMVAVTVADLRSGEKAIGMAADTVATERWRAKSIRTLWREMNPALPQLSDQQVLQIMEGDMGGLPEGFTFDPAFLLGGQPTLKLSPVGMLLLGIDGQYFPHCSGILTRPDAFLTARHCVSNLHTGETLKVYIPFEGLRDPVIDGVSLFCKDDDSTCNSLIDDLALIELAEAYTITPLAKPGIVNSTAIGSSAKILGFGLNDVSLSDNGVLREGKIVLDGCNACEIDGVVDTDPSAGGRRLCFDYSTGGTSGSGISIQGNVGGDSGGPMFSDIAGPNSLIGVSSRVDWRCSDAEEQEGMYVNTTNPVYQEWMDETFCTPPCRGLSIDEVDLLAIEASEEVDGSTGLDERLVTVAQWTKKLIVTLNHEINGYDPNPNDLNLVLPAEWNDPCERHDGVEVCVVNKPDAGNFLIGVKQNYGNPEYQLVVVATRCPDKTCWDDFESQAARPLLPQDLKLDR